MDYLFIQHKFLLYPAVRSSGTQLNPPKSDKWGCPEGLGSVGQDTNSVKEWDAAGRKDVPQEICWHEIQFNHYPNAELEHPELFHSSREIYVFSSCYQNSQLIFSLYFGFLYWIVLYALLFLIRLGVRILFLTILNSTGWIPVIYKIIKKENSWARHIIVLP